MIGYLTLMDGSFIGVRDGLVLGRVAGCDVVVHDNKASRRHARVIVEGGVVEIEDLGSSNGTMLNGKPVTRRMLRDGDEVQIGKSVFVYREGAVPGIGPANATAAHPPTPRAPATSGSGTAVPPGGDDLGDDLPDNDLLGNDLLGGDELAADDASPTQVESPPRPVPPQQQAAARPAAPPQSQSRPPAPQPPRAAAPPPPANVNVVEFEDEIVAVKKPAPAAPVAAAGGQHRAEGVVATSQRVLQFSKKSGGSGLLGDDMGQMSAGMRALLVIGALALGAAIVWGVSTLAR